MDKIDFLSNTSCSPNKKLVEGCANGVSYMVVICDSDCGATTSLAYLNMSTGLTESTPPIDFVLGNCMDKTFKVGCIPYLETETFNATAGQTTFTVANAPSGDVRFSRNGSTLDDAAATVSGTTVTYVPAANNGEVLLATDRIEISYVYAVCDVAVVPFVDCAGKEILNGAALVKCDALDPASFSVDPTTGIISTTGGGGGGTGGQALTDCKGTVLANGSSVLGCDALDPDTFVIDPATGEVTIINNIKGQALTDCKGDLLPQGTSVVSCDALDPNNFTIDPVTGEISISGGGGGTSQALTDCKGVVLPNGTSVLSCDALDPDTFIIDPNTGELTLVGGKGSVVTVADLITGHKIAKITVDGVAYTINETITSIGALTYDSVTGLLSIPYTDETGTLNTKTVTVAPTFVNTDGQQITGDNSGTVDLTLTAVVVGGVTNYTVKADLNVAATTPSGGVNQLKWSASLNGYYVEDIDVVYDGSETKVIAGTNVTVTGTGTTGDPYVIGTTGNSVAVTDLITGHKIGTITVDGVAKILNETITSIGTITYSNGVITIPYTDEAGVINNKTVSIPVYDGSETKVIAGTNTTVTGTGTATDPYVINSNGGSTGGAGTYWTTRGLATTTDLVVDALTFGLTTGANTQLRIKSTSGTALSIQVQGYSTTNSAIVPYTYQTSALTAYVTPKSAWDAASTCWGEFAMVWDRTNDKIYEVRYQRFSGSGVTPVDYVMTVVRTR